MIKKATIDITKQPTEKQVEMLENLNVRPLVFDDDCPELTGKDLARFNKVSQRKEF